MHEDVADGVRFLIAERIADSSRICIVGSGYGGYAAVMGPTLTPDLYACGVGINAVSNLRELFGYLNHLFAFGKESNTVAGWKDLVGDPYGLGPEAELVEAPIAAFNVPMLMIHAIGDSVVPYRQTDNFVRLLANHQLPYTLLPLEDEDHWLSTSESRIQVLEALERFLAKQLQPERAPGAGT